MLYKNYHNYSDIDKQKIIQKLYIDNKLSFEEIAKLTHTYANKIRRDAKKYNIPIRNKSEAQINALKTGKHKHPTKGTVRTNDTKQKIGNGVMESWNKLSETELNIRKENSKQKWDQLSEEEKKYRLNLANQAVRNSSKKGSKLEHYLLTSLVQDSYRIEFHKEQILSNTKLQIDLFIPTMNIAIEVDGPSHFLPVWGTDTLARNKKYDEKKTGLIIGKGLKLIRIKQTHDFSKARAKILYNKLIQAIDSISNSNQTLIQIED